VDTGHPGLGREPVVCQWLATAPIPLSRNKLWRAWLTPGSRPRLRKTVRVPLHAVKMADGPRLASEFEGLRTLSLRHSERLFITELGSAPKSRCQSQQQLVMVQGGRKKESLAVSEGRNSVSRSTNINTLITVGGRIDPSQCPFYKDIRLRTTNVAPFITCAVVRAISLHVRNRMTAWKCGRIPDKYRRSQEACRERSTDCRATSTNVLWENRVESATRWGSSKGSLSHAKANNFDAGGACACRKPR